MKLAIKLLITGIALSVVGAVADFGGAPSGASMNVVDYVSLAGFIAGLGLVVVSLVSLYLGRRRGKQATPVETPSGPAIPSYRRRGVGLLVLLIALLGVFALALVFAGSTATGNPIHWFLVFVSYSSLFGILSSAGLAGMHLRNIPISIGCPWKLAVGVLIGALVITAILHIQTPHETQLPWAFQGAYANYTSSGFLPNGLTYGINLSMKALTANGQTVHLQVYASSEVGGGTPTTYTNDSWVSATRFGGLNPLSSSQKLVRAFAQNLTLNGAVVPTTVYEYSTASNNQTVLIDVFVRSGVEFPVQFVYNFNGQFQIAVPVTKTNIPGLLS